MPPRVKFSREEIVQAALDVAREKGADAMTTRDIAAKLGVSTQPIFTYFRSMREVRAAVHAAAETFYQKYAAEGLAEEIPFLGYGMRHIRFAREEPELYRLLFLTHDAGEKGAMDAMRHSLDYVKEPLERIYHISEAEAERYFRDLWIVVYGIAALIVTGDCPYSDAEIGAILTGFSLSICKAIKEIPGFVSGDFDRDRLFTEMIGGCKNG